MNAPRGGPLYRGRRWPAPSLAIDCSPLRAAGNRGRGVARWGRVPAGRLPTPPRDARTPAPFLAPRICCRTLLIVVSSAARRRCSHRLRLVAGRGRGAAGPKRARGYPRVNGNATVNACSPATCREKNLHARPRHAPVCWFPCPRPLPRGRRRSTRSRVSTLSSPHFLVISPRQILHGRRVASWWRWRVFLINKSARQ